MKKYIKFFFFIYPLHFSFIDVQDKMIEQMRGREDDMRPHLNAMKTNSGAEPPEEQIANLTASSRKLSTNNGNKSVQTH